MQSTTQNYTAFNTPFGAFEWLRKPMGLRGSPNTIQSLMEHVLVGITWSITKPYLYDCIDFWKTPEEHNKRLKQVFQRFSEANLKINPTKIAFVTKKSSLLRTCFQLKWIGCRSKEIRSSTLAKSTAKSNGCSVVLRKLSYFRRYIKNFAITTRPLPNTSKTRSPFVGTKETHEAFESSKKYSSSSPVLHFPDLKEPSILYTDAILTTTRAVLAQVPYGEERAICYASKAFSNCEMKYSATRKLLATLTFTRHFKHYLLGRKFQILHSSSCTAVAPQI